MNDFNDLNSQTFGQGGENPPSAQAQNYVTYIPYGFTPKLFEEKTKIKKIANITGGAILVSNVIPYIISYIIIFTLLFTGISQEEVNNILDDAAFNKYFQIVVSSIMFTLPFVIFFKAAGYRISDLAIYSKPKKKTVLPLFLMGISFCAFANIAVSIAGNIFSQFGINYEVERGLEPQGLLGFILTTIATAIVPALVEEFAFRGLVLGSLRKFGDGFAIIVSSIVFGIMHENFEQIPFAFLVGLALGYVTVKSGCLWVAMAVHAFNNFISVVFSYLPKSLPDMAQNAMYVVLLAILLVLGIISINLFRKSGECFELEKSQTEATNKQKATWFFTGVTIIIFIVVSFIEALSFFK